MLMHTARNLIDPLGETRITLLRNNPHAVKQTLRRLRHTNFEYEMSFLSDFVVSHKSNTVTLSFLFHCFKVRKRKKSLTYLYVKSRKIYGCI